VTAALLLEQGYDVVGVTMRLFDGEESDEGGRGCCGSAGSRDAARVASKLGFPHYTWDFRSEFATSVVEDFCSEYGCGRTPNPCLRCNEVLKFAELLNRAPQLGADLIATGHYARIVARDMTGKRGLYRASARSEGLSPLSQVKAFDCTRGSGAASARFRTGSGIGSDM
jgi:tRNA-specific 2-thiouridylase